MKRITLLLFTLPFIGSMLAQAPAIEWQTTIGSTGYDFLNAIGQTSDGGYILGGYSDGNISGNKSEDNFGGDDYWIVKLNAAGNVEWENTVGGGNFDRFYSVEETNDGGFILGGQSLSGGGWGDKSESNKGGYDYWIVKLNASGVVEWDRSYGGIGNDQLYNAQPTTDGGYMLAGTSDSGISGDKTENRVGNSDFWIIKIDATGNIIWQNDIGGLMFDNVYSAYETADGGYILGGTSTSGISGDKTAGNYGVVDYWIVKLNASGTVVWDKTIGGTLNDYLYTVIPTADGGSIACGMSESGLTGNKTDNTNGLYDYYIVKLDNSGNITWQNSIGGTGNDYTFVNAITQTSDGGYAIAGYSQSAISGDKTEANTGSWDYWIIKITNLGAISWQTVLGGASGDYANAISTTADEGFIIGGYSYSNASGEKTENAFGDADYWVLKLAGTGCYAYTESCNGLDDDCDALVDEDIIETISITADGATSFCQGGNVLLTATHSGTSLQWKKNGVNIIGATASTYLASLNGNYTCVTTSDCNTATSNSITVSVIKNPKASITAGGPTTFCAGGSVTLTEMPVGASTYQWYKGASLIAGATSTTYVATTSGNYKCRVTKTATGCFKNSNTIAVSVPCREGETILNSNLLSVFPNPNNGTFTLKANIQSQNISIQQPVIINIYNNLGQVIYSHLSYAENGIVNELITLNNIAQGIYIVKLNEYLIQSKLIIE